VKAIHITGIEVCAEGVLRVRTVTVTKRWYQKKPRHDLRVFYGWRRAWTEVGTDGQPLTRQKFDGQMYIVLDGVYERTFDDMATSEPRAVSRPSFGGAEAQGSN
jgi:hypothetical protein